MCSFEKIPFSTQTYFHLKSITKNVFHWNFLSYLGIISQISPRMRHFYGVRIQTKIHKILTYGNYFTWTVVISSGLLPDKNCNGPSYPCNSLLPDNGRLPRLTLDADLRSEACINFPASRFCLCFCSIRRRCCSNFCWRKLADGIASNL